MNDLYEKFDSASWNMTEAFANELSDDNLFPRPVRPQDSELGKVHKRLKQLILNKELNKDNVTIKEQRVLPWILLPCLSGSFNGLLSIAGSWDQIFRLLSDKARFDPPTLETLAFEWNSRAPSYLVMAAPISIQIEKMLSQGNSVRLKRALGNLTFSNDAKGLPLNWAVSIMKRGQKQLKSMFDVFGNAAKNYHIDKELNDDVHFARMRFWRCYFTEGIVKNCWIACDPTTRDIYFKNDNSVLEISQNNGRQLAIIFEIGPLIIVEWINPKIIYLHSELASFKPKLNAETITLEDLKSVISMKHNFSNMGYWQYRIAAGLKKHAQFMPSRSDYLL